MSEGDDVGEEGAPAFGLAVWEEWHDGGFGGCGEEGDHLEDVGGGEGAEVGELGPLEVELEEHLLGRGGVEVHFEAVAEDEGDGVGG